MSVSESLRILFCQNSAVTLIFFFFFLQTRPLAVFAWRAASSLTCLGPMVAPGLIFTGSTSEAVTGKLFLLLMINDKRQFDLNMKR